MDKLDDIKELFHKMIPQRVKTQATAREDTGDTGSLPGLGSPHALG